MHNPVMNYTSYKIVIIAYVLLNISREYDIYEVILITVAWGKLILEKFQFEVFNRVK